VVVDTFWRCEIDAVSPMNLSIGHFMSIHRKGIKREAYFSLDSISTKGLSGSFQATASVPHL
jgi:hypothetical protein